MPDPEALAREDIDRQLELAGWLVQDRDRMNLFVGPSAGEADLMLIANE